MVGNGRNSFFVWHAMYHPTAAAAAAAAAAILDRRCHKIEQ